jgi:hypothetical protein
MKIKLGSLDYDLVMTDKKIEFEEEDMVLGLIEEPKCTITIYKNVPNQTKEQTFWHETIHGMMAELGQYDLFENEGFIDAFAKQLHMFLKRNDINKIYDKLHN